MTTRRALAVLVAATVLVLPACGDDDPSGTAATELRTTAGNAPSTTSAGELADLVGLFAIDAGQCRDAGATRGSWFRMVQPGGTRKKGPFVANADSACKDTTFTALTPGTDGGLRTGTHQPPPNPPFGPDGGALADAIVEPTKFAGAVFAVSTNPTDPVNKIEVPAPSVENDFGELDGYLSAVNVAWNGHQFNQGSPKPGGSHPGLTSHPKGPFDPDTLDYTLEWASQIVGGPFNGFTGVWHLEGTFARD